MVQAAIDFEAEVHTVTMARPDDVSEVARLFDNGLVAPAHVVAVMAQTEGGNEERAAAVFALAGLLGSHLDVSPQSVADTIPMLMIGGTAGLMCPHITLFVNKPATGPGCAGVKRLVLAAGSTAVLAPEDCGTLREVEAVARAVTLAMHRAGINDPADVQSVQLKTPVLTAEGAADAERRGYGVCSTDLAHAASLTRGAAALGAAVALGELTMAALLHEDIAGSTQLYSRKTFASAGGEQSAVRVLVIGNADGAPGSLRATAGVMAHALDLPGAHQVFADAGLALTEGRVREQDGARIRAVFIKAGADALPHVHGRRHTMGDDPAGGSSGHQAKAVAHALVSAIVGDTLVLANAGAEHQGPPGSNLLCVIASD